MEIEVAREVVMHLNHPKIMDAITIYAESRLKKLREQLETTKDDRRVHELQGSIEEIKRLFSLREHALAVVDGEKR